MPIVYKNKTSQYKNNIIYLFISKNKKWFRNNKQQYRYKLSGYYLLEQNQNKFSGLMLDKSEMQYTQKEISFSTIVENYFTFFLIFSFLLWLNSVCLKTLFYVISTKGRNLLTHVFSIHKISRSARNDNFGYFSDRH